MVVMMVGCVHRQTAPPSLVYQEAMAPDRTGAAAAPVNAGGSLVIEPPPPPPVAAPPPPAVATAPAVVPRKPRPKFQEHASEDAPAAPDAAPAKSAEAPPLESVTEPASEAGVRNQLRTLGNEIDHLQHGFSLSATDRRTLEDARTFLLQSQQALADHDLLRADQLAKKAALLLAAVEPAR